MKKTLVTLTVAAFVFGALTLAGCAKKAEETPAAETPAMTDTTSMAPTETMMDSSSMMEAPADTAAAH